MSIENDLIFFSLLSLLLPSPLLAFPPIPSFPLPTFPSLLFPFACYGLIVMFLREGGGVIGAEAETAEFVVHFGILIISPRMLL